MPLFRCIDVKLIQHIVVLIALVYASSTQAQTFSVYFDTDKAVVKNTSSLDSAAKAASKANNRVFVECHCDDRANSDYNLKLSMRRAESVSAYLLQKGVKTEIVMQGFGKERPVYANTPEMRHKNRRCDITLTQPQEIEQQSTTENKNIDLTAVKKADLVPGTRLTLNGLEFVGNQAVPMYYSMPQLYYLLQLMIENEGLKIFIRGHVCCGPDQNLSDARAKAVYDFLVKNGIDSNRLGHKGFSNDEPLVEETSRAAEQKNRRVEADVVQAPTSTTKLALPEKPVFEAKLLDISFERTQLDYAGKYNLNLIAGMIKRSKGYTYTIRVYHPQQATAQRKRKALESYFQTKGIIPPKLTIIMGNDEMHLGSDILLLTIQNITK